TLVTRRVTIADYRGNLLLDTLVRPTCLFRQPVSDYRPSETGLQQSMLDSGSVVPSSTVQRRVAELIRDKIIIGYALWNFLSVMGLAHSAIDTRDIALFMPFRRSLRGKPNVVIPLLTLVNRFMGRNIGLQGESPVEIARATLDLFRSCEHVWEEIIETGAWPCTLPPVVYASHFT
ncbi:nucleotide-binding protein FRT1, partial [Daedalea quercina L-15889]